MRRWRQALAANWSKTTIVMIRILKTGITYLSKLVEIYAAVSPGLGSEMEQGDHCRDPDPQEGYHLPSKLVEINAASTGITYLSKLVEIYAAVSPGLGSEMEQGDHCRDPDPQEGYHLPF